MTSKRKDHRLFLLYSTVTQSEKELKGAKLPSKRQIIQSFIAHKESLDNNSENSDKKTLREAAKKVTDNVIIFYEKARIPTVFPQKMTDKILDFYSEMKSLQKIPEERRESGKPKERIDKFIKELDMSFPFWPRDALDRIDNEEDKA